MALTPIRSVSTDARARARAIMTEAETHDGFSAISDQALLAATQGQRELVRFVEGDAPVAVGVVGQGELDLVVRPDARGRGVGREALRTLLSDAGPGDLRAWAHGAENPAAEALLDGVGFTPVRTLYRMDLDPALLPNDGQDPLAIATPNGLELRAFDPASETDAVAWVRANAAAFHAHPEQGRVTESDFALMREEAWFAPEDLILLADTATDELAGSTWIKTVRDDGVETELYAVGVRPEYAGNRLGTLLLRVTLARMAQHDPDRVSLYVDGENEAAVRLYQAAEFTIGSSSRQWRRGPITVVNATMDA